MRYALCRCADKPANGRPLITQERTNKTQNLYLSLSTRDLSFGGSYSPFHFVLPLFKPRIHQPPRFYLVVSFSSSLVRRHTSTLHTSRDIPLLSALPSSPV